MAGMIQFSVIIPNYNHARFLQQRIDSVLSQAYPPSEIIILDDASTDDSRTIIEQYRDHPLVRHIIYNEQNSGSPFLQWEEGLALTNYDWIWIAESDDHCSDRFLATAASSLQQNLSAGIFYCDAKLDGPSGTTGTFASEKNRWFNTKKWSADYFSPGMDELQECLGTRCTINNVSSTVMKKEWLAGCIKKVAGFRFHGDWYCYAYIATKAGIVYSAEPLNAYRYYSSGIQSQLPADGRHREECFRILDFLYRHFHSSVRETMVEQFVSINLSTGLISGRKEWMRYFKINKQLALKVMGILIKNRFASAKTVGE